jgi:HlyD family secretion protein
MKLSTRWRVALGVLAILLLVVWRLRPKEIVVDTVEASRGPLRETVNEQGETRVHDRYVVAAPITGRLDRVLLRAGDPVRRGAVVAWLEPAPLDARTRQQAAAQVAGAEDALRAAQAVVRAAQAALDQAARARLRADSLAAAGHLSSAQREEAELLETTRRRELDAASARAETAAHDLERARATLIAASSEESCRQCDRTPIRAPVDGRVLRLLEESERIVAAGTPVLEVGNPSRLEVVTDLLSTDAVNVRTGDTVLIEDWGGGHTLRGRVRIVEPSGFTKISALGVEEQRVNVIADLVGEPGPLGDRYRVEVRVVMWGAADVLKIPLSALIRRGQDWAVMVARDGRARLRPLTLGHRGEFEVEVLQGLEAGEEVIRFPSDLIRDRTRVRARPPEATSR